MLLHIPTILYQCYL